MDGKVNHAVTRGYGRDALLVKALKLSWLQGFAGPESPVVSAYGATAIPATFLISTNGKILARDLRGEKTRKIVVEALKPFRPASE